MSITELKRNDVSGALAFYRERVLAGKWKHEHAVMVLRLQDDPADLMKAMLAAADEPEMAAALKRGK